MKTQKDLNYYKSLEYEIVIENIKQGGESWYHCYAREFGRMSCYGTGETHDEALKNFLIDKDEFIELNYAKELPIPEPTQKEFDRKLLSGIFNVRTTPQIHTRLTQQAKENGVSLNSHVNHLFSSSSILGEVMKYMDHQFKKVEDKMEEHHCAVIYSLTNYEISEFEPNLIIKESEFKKFSDSIQSVVYLSNA
jgi:predicted RNase H-like HicB family nuclease